MGVGVCLCVHVCVCLCVCVSVCVCVGWRCLLDRVIAPEWMWYFDCDLLVMVDFAHYIYT